jgi:Nif11 domain
LQKSDSLHKDPEINFQIVYLSLETGREACCVMFSQNNAAQFFNSLRSDLDRQLRLRSLKNPGEFMRMAEKRGYRFQGHQLNDDIARLSEDELAAIWNPGIGPRRHLIRR